MKRSNIKLNFNVNKKKEKYLVMLKVHQNGIFSHQSKEVNLLRRIKVQ